MHGQQATTAAEPAACCHVTASMHTTISMSTFYADMLAGMQQALTGQASVLHCCRA